jgi:hypothetical protein
MTEMPIENDNNNNVEPQSSVDNLPDNIGVNNSEPKAEAVSTPETAVKKVSPFEKRIGKLYGKLQDKDRELAELKQRFEEFSKNVPVKEKEYANAEEYLKDRVQNILRDEQEKLSQTQKNNAKASSANEKWNAKLSKFKEANPDVDVDVWQAAVSDLTPDANNHIGEFANDSEIGPELLNEVLTSDEHLEKLNDLSPRGREKYLQKLEDQLMSGKLTSNQEAEHDGVRTVDKINNPTPKASLPKPPTPGSGKNASVVGKTLQDLAKKQDLKEYFALLKANKRKK